MCLKCPLLAHACFESRMPYVGLASHWPCVTDTVVYPTDGLNGQRQGDEHPCTHMSLQGVALFTFLPLTGQWMCQLCVVQCCAKRCSS